MSILFITKINEECYSFIICRNETVYNVIEEDGDVAIFDMFENKHIEDSSIVSYIKNRVH